MPSANFGYKVALNSSVFNSATDPGPIDGNFGPSIMTWPPTTRNSILSTRLIGLRQCLRIWVPDPSRVSSSLALQEAL